jgi:hypothetical protein
MTDDYEIFFNVIDADREPGWYWRAKIYFADGTGWAEHGPFATADEARADAEENFSEEEAR